jgi:hypothetical protein
MMLSVDRIIVRKRTVFLVVLTTLALGLVGTSLSTLYEQDVLMLPKNQETITFKVSYGFPFAWHGYSITEPNFPPHMPGATYNPTYNPTYWFSLESISLDGLFWFTISFFVSATAVKSVQMLLKTIASKVVVTYFLASASFSIVGSCLYLFSYEDLGLKLYAFGMFLVVASFYQSLIGKKKAEPLRGSVPGALE